MRRGEEKVKLEKEDETSRGFASWNTTLLSYFQKRRSSYFQGLMSYDWVESGRLPHLAWWLKLIPIDT